MGTDQLGAVDPGTTATSGRVPERRVWPRTAVCCFGSQWAECPETNVVSKHESVGSQHAEWDESAKRKRHSAATLEREQWPTESEWTARTERVEEWSVERAAESAEQWLVARSGKDEWAKWTERTEWSVGKWTE